jgi:hypothetical protein
MGGGRLELVAKRPWVSDIYGCFSGLRGCLERDRLKVRKLSRLSRRVAARLGTWRAIQTGPTRGEHSETKRETEARWKYDISAWSSGVPRDKMSLLCSCLVHISSLSHLRHTFGFVQSQNLSFRRGREFSFRGPWNIRLRDGIQMM